MADISITATAVAPGTDAVIRNGTAGATITAGQPVYLDANNRYQLADSDSATALARSPVGHALHGASSGQPLAIIETGDLTLNAVLTAGLAYYLSKTAGGICPVADIASGGYPVVLGIAKSTTVLKIVRGVEALVAV